MNLNKVTIAGRLVRDVEIKALPTGTPVASLNVATNSYFTKDGQRQESVEYHNIVVFGQVAQNCASYLAKGQLVLIEGSLRTRSWEANGAKHYRTEIVANNVQFGPRGGEEKPKSNYQPKSSAPSSPAKPQQSMAIKYPEEEINPDDIPF